MLELKFRMEEGIMLDAAMQARGKAHMTRVLGQPQNSPKIIGLMTALFVVVGGLSFYFWPTAPGDDQLGRLAVLSSCNVHTPGQAWLEARSAVGASGNVLTSGQRRAAMNYLLGERADGVCNNFVSDNDDREALAFAEGD
jgi:hypothetical protein